MTREPWGWPTGVLLAVGVSVLYWTTFSRIPSADAYWYISNINNAQIENILNPTSALTQYFFFSLRRALTGFGASVDTLRLIQTVNAAVAGVGVALFYATLRQLGASRALGLLGAVVLATTFGYWFYTNGEFQHPSLVVLLAIFHLLVRQRASGGPWSPWFVAAVALMNSLAALLRQENFLFGFAAVALIMLGRPWRAGLRDAIVYTVVGSLGTFVLVFTLGRFALGARTIDDFIRWYLYILAYTKLPREYQEFEFATAFDIPRVIKGQLTAFFIGTQAVVDVVRDRTLLAYAKVDALLGLTAIVYGAMVWLAADAWRLRRVLPEWLLPPAVASLVWLLTYKVLVHAWFWPTYTKYQVVTLPPLIFLLLLAPLAAQEADGVGRRGVRVGVVALLLAALAVGNAWGAIVPQYRYGRLKERVAAWRAAALTSGDLVISSESGLDVVFASGVHHLAVKDVFMRGRPKQECFDAIRSAIDAQLRRPGRAYMYNLVPSPFTVIGINQHMAAYWSAGGRPEQVSVRDFEAFFDELRATYPARPVFTYWEETKVPLYLYGERLQPLWELAPRGPA